MPHHASLQILVPRGFANEPYAGEFERRRSAFQRGGWGSEPPDPGSAPTSKNRNPLIHIICRSALNNNLSLLIPN
jgi:hypothetical protein